MILKKQIILHIVVITEIWTSLLTHIFQGIFHNVGQMSESMNVKDSERLAMFQLRKSTKLQKYLNMRRRIVKRLA